MAITGCSPAPVAYPPAPTRYYVATFDTTRSTEGGALPRQSDVLAKDAPPLLAPGKTIAFLPPDSCATENVAPSGTEQGSTTILMKCGALLASLEAEVAKAGYSVVSWQSLKSTGAGSSQDRARALNVDVLFEVNQLSQEPRDAGARQLSNMAFSTMEKPSDTAAASVSRDVAARCAGLLPRLQRAGEKEFTSTLNLKAVDVKSGRALWLYQNTVVEVVGADGVTQEKLYFRADGVRPPSPMQVRSAMSVLGGAAVGVGIGGLLISTLVYTQADADGALPWMGLSAAAIAGGIVMMILGRGSQAGQDVPPASYPAPADVLCVGNPLANPWATASSGGAPGEESSTSYSYTQTKSADRDFERERVRRLALKITADFVGALKLVAQGR